VVIETGSWESSLALPSGTLIETGSWESSLALPSGTLSSTNYFIKKQVPGHFFPFSTRDSRFSWKRLLPHSPRNPFILSFYCEATIRFFAHRFDIDELAIDNTNILYP
jgi:hypothetical protein